MEKNVALSPEIYDQVVARARAEQQTPDEWLNEAAAARLAREDTMKRLRTLTRKNREDVVALGVQPSDVPRESSGFRRSG